MVEGARPIVDALCVPRCGGGGGVVGTVAVATMATGSIGDGTATNSGTGDGGIARAIERLGATLVGGWLRGGGSGERACGGDGGAEGPRRVELAALGEMVAGAIDAGVRVGAAAGVDGGEAAGGGLTTVVVSAAGRATGAGKSPTDVPAAP